MAKRFTDSNKWRNEWFRTLSIKAKLAWIYLCDECESHGVFKIDYGLASFQLGFEITATVLVQWFENKLHFFDFDKVLIIPFFEFQYGESKDSWTAKIRAKEKLQSLGFQVIENKVFIENHTTVGGQSPDCDPTRLIIGRGRVRVNNKEIEEKIEKIYSEHYPLKKGKSKGIEKLVKELQTTQDLEQFEMAVNRYKASIRDPKFIKHFSTFATEWRDWLDSEAGEAVVDSPKTHDVSHLWDEK